MARRAVGVTWQATFSRCKRAHPQSVLSTRCRPGDGYIMANLDPSLHVLCLAVQVKLFETGASHGWQFGSRGGFPRGAKSSGVKKTKKWVRLEKCVQPILSSFHILLQNIKSRLTPLLMVCISKFSIISKYPLCIKHWHAQSTLKFHVA